MGETIMIKTADKTEDKIAQALEQIESAKPKLAQLSRALEKAEIDLELSTNYDAGGANDSNQTPTEQTLLEIIEEGISSFNSGGSIGFDDIVFWRCARLPPSEQTI